MKDYFKDLQLFGEGGTGDGGASGDAGNSVVDSPDDGESRLLELGVPADKIRKRSQGKTVTKSAEVPAPAEPTGADNQDTPAEANTEPAKASFDELMKDPEYNKRMQDIVRSRLGDAKAAEERMNALAPVIDLLAKQYGMDVNNLDYAKLAENINSDDRYYEEKALEMGVSVDTAKRIDQDERETARREREEAQTLEKQKFQNHIRSLEEQGDRLKTVFPNFDLRTELQNPAFARMTSPSVGLSVEDAFYAVHRREIQQSSMQAAANATRQKVTNAIMSGSARPVENGINGQSASVTSFDYSKASRQQRDELKRQIRAAAARGEKLYPK